MHRARRPFASVAASLMTPKAPAVSGLGVSVPRLMLSSLDENVQRLAVDNLPPTVLSPNPLGDAPEDLNKFFEIPGD